MCIETDRLLLNPVSEQYADEVFQHFRGEVLTYMAADAPESREAVGALIARARRLGIQRLRYPVDRRNIASKKIPLYYGGRLTPQSRTVRLPGGRVLEEVTYEIVPAARENGKT